MCAPGSPIISFHLRGLALMTVPVPVRFDWLFDPGKPMLSVSRNYTFFRASNLPAHQEFRCLQEALGEQ